MPHRFPSFLLLFSFPPLTSTFAGGGFAKTNSTPPALLTHTATRFVHTRVLACS